LSKKDTGGGQDILDISRDEITVLEPKVKVDLTKFVEEHKYAFDRCFAQSVENRQMHEECVMPLIADAFAGGKCTVFAYGQTGSGKTFTLLGAPKARPPAPGLLMLAAGEIFARASVSSDILVGISFYEIYSGKLYDLLNQRSLLCVRENGRQQVVVVGLREERVTTVEHLLEVIDAGLLSRTTGATAGNADSSRSHAVVQIRLIESVGERERGKLSFIDLAGSERGADTVDQNRTTRKDGAEINKSLLALKECIRALDQQKEHQPFRGSKLTQVLKDSFVGETCRTVMIANISSSSMNVEQTLNTLRYAWRVREIRSGSLRRDDQLTPREEASRPGFDVQSAIHTSDSQTQLPLPKEVGSGHEAGSDLSLSSPRGQVLNGFEAGSDFNLLSPRAKATLAARHDALVEALCVEEDEVIAFHRSHIDNMVHRLKEQMEALNAVDVPGSDVDSYATTLAHALKAQEQEIVVLRERLRSFDRNLREERELSNLFTRGSTAHAHVAC
jgi:kinesin family protein 2/24